MAAYSVFNPSSLRGGLPFVIVPLSAPPFDRGKYFRQDGSSVNAVSFGFVATAVLICVFLVIAIFERFLRPRRFIPPILPGDRESGVIQSPGVRTPMKEEDLITGSSYAVGISVVMPGQEIPSFIAKPVPVPFPSEGIFLPITERDHDGSFGFYTSTSTAMKSGESDLGEDIV